MSTAGTATVSNEGVYVARLTVSCTLAGASVSQQTGDILVGTSGSLGIPAAATDIFITGEEFTGFSWNEIFMTSFPTPVIRCYRVWGTRFDPKWEEVSCS